VVSLNTKGSRKKFSIILVANFWPPLKQFLLFSSSPQGCQMVSFQTKNSNLGKFWSYLDGKIVKYFRAIWNILRTFGIFYNHLVYFT
jgi:hypothetical protein